MASWKAWRNGLIAAALLLLVARSFFFAGGQSGTAPHSGKPPLALTTVLIMGYSPERRGNYDIILPEYASMVGLVDQVVVVWCHPTASPPKLPPPSLFHVPITVVQAPDSSLNNRFGSLAASLVRTDSVLVVDDDLLVPQVLVRKILLARRGDGDALVGLDGRTVSQSGEYIRPGILNYLSVILMPGPWETDIVLTKTMLVPTRFLAAYTQRTDIMAYVDSVKNCEDIAMNAVAHTVGQLRPQLLSSVTLPLWLKWTGIGEVLAGRIRWGLAAPSGISDGTKAHDLERTKCVQFLGGAELFHGGEGGDIVRHGSSGEKRSLLRLASPPGPASPPAQVATQTTTQTKQTQPPAPLCFTSLLFNEGMLTEFRVLGLSLVETGAVRLGRSSGRHATPMIAFITDSVSESSAVLLQNDGWTIKRVSFVSNPNDAHPSRFSGVYTKLKVFELQDECSKVAFLDADTFVVRDPTAAFMACPGFCAVMRHSERFNSGVMVLVPGKAISQHLFDVAGTTESYTGGDQGMLNTLFPEMVDAPMVHQLNDDPQTGEATWGLGLDGRSKGPVKLGLELARFSTGFNAEPGMYWITNRWSHPGGESMNFVLHFTLGPFKSSQWTMPLFLPAFVGWGWDKTHAKFAPFQTLRIATAVLAALACGTALRVRATVVAAARDSSGEARAVVPAHVLALLHFAALWFALHYCLPVPTPSAFIEAAWSVLLGGLVAAELEVVAACALLARWREPELVWRRAAAVATMFTFPVAWWLGGLGFHPAISMVLRVLTPTLGMTGLSWLFLLRRRKAMNSSRAKLG